MDDWTKPRPPCDISKLGFHQFASERLIKCDWQGCPPALSPGAVPLPFSCLMKEAPHLSDRTSRHRVDVTSLVWTPRTSAFQLHSLRHIRFWVVSFWEMNTIWQIGFQRAANHVLILQIFYSSILSPFLEDSRAIAIAGHGQASWNWNSPVVCSAFVEVNVFGKAHYKNKGIIRVSRHDKP